MSKTADYSSMEEIAIIGAAGQFPESETLESFWQNLSQGKELITFFSDDELLEEGIDPSLLRNTHYMKAKGFLEHADCFDAEFFGFSRREAEVLDPQQRRLLEWAWSALEVAGYDSEQYKGLIGVFACSSLSSYFYLNLLPQLYNSTQNLQDEMLMVMGNEKDFLATRISYKMNLKGPSKSIQTACSSSLVAVHDACQSLLNYECDIALAGGVSITFPQKNGYLYSKEGISSPDGHCRAFDHLAAGTLTGNGGGVVVLKRLQDALADGDTIYSIIKGSCVNNDGADKVGYTAPSIKGQANAIITAHLAARVDPATITYVECHGTGTILGDPVEIQALTQAFQVSIPKNLKQFCAIGSVKTNMGHLDAAAGIAGLIKTMLALHFKQIPPSLNFEKPNPKISLEDSPFYVNTKLVPWVSNQTPCRAGVSSFGIGGTNAHVVLEKAPASNPSMPSKYTSFLAPFSAKNGISLKLMLSNFLTALDSLTCSLADLTYTLQIGRRSFDHRVCFIASSKKELQQMIGQYLVQEHSSEKTLDSPWKEVANRWLNGETVNWSQYYQNETRQRVSLPTYPFAKNRYLIKPRPLFGSTHSLATQEKSHPTNHHIEHHVRAKNKMEEHLISIWEDSLKARGIGSDDNFFNLGGDSLIALEITDKIRSSLPVEVTLQHILEHPTIASLAAAFKQDIMKKIDDLSDDEAAVLLELV